MRYIGNTRESQGVSFESYHSARFLSAIFIGSHPYHVLYQERFCKAELKAIKVYDRLLTRLFKAQTGLKDNVKEE